MISKEEESKIMQLKESGKSYDEISSVTGISKSTISRVVNSNGLLSKKEKDEISEMLSSERARIKELISNFRDEIYREFKNFTPEVTMDSLMQFRNELLKDIREQVREEVLGQLEVVFERLDNLGNRLTKIEPKVTYTTADKVKKAIF